MEYFTLKWIIHLYLEVLHANYLSLREEEQVAFNQQVSGALAELEEGVMAELVAPFDFDNDEAPGWREHLTASWLCGLKGWQQFAPTIGNLLLASETCYAGQGYCFALACFANEESAAYLTEYLDFYLPQLDLDYDQHWAMPALMWIDEQQGTTHAARFLKPGGLWEQYSAGKPSPYWEIETLRDYFWDVMSYCRANFMCLNTADS